jgi:hypothetical protein
MDTPETTPEGPMKWEVSDAYPHGHAVPFTPDELRQHDLDLAVAAAFAALPPRPDPVVEIVNVVLGSPDEFMLTRRRRNA